MLLFQGVLSLATQLRVEIMIHQRQLTTDHVRVMWAMIGTEVLVKHFVLGATSPQQDLCVWTQMQMTRGVGQVEVFQMKGIMEHFQTMVPSLNVQNMISLKDWTVQVMAEAEVTGMKDTIRSIPVVPHQLLAVWTHHIARTVTTTYLQMLQAHVLVMQHIHSTGVAVYKYLAG